MTIVVSDIQQSQWLDMLRRLFIAVDDPVNMAYDKYTKSASVMEILIEFNDYLDWDNRVDLIFSRLLQYHDQHNLALFCMDKYIEDSGLCELPYLGTEVVQLDDLDHWLKTLEQEREVVMQQFYQQVTVH